MVKKILLTEYQKIGKKLVPPLLQIPKLHLDSWINNRMPEMLWATLIRTNMDRQRALQKFSSVGAYFHKHKEREDIEPDVTLSGIAGQPHDFQKYLLEIICDPETLGYLGSLLMFKQLPGRNAWEQYLSPLEDETAWGLIARAVLECFEHDSVVSTDCRAAKLVPIIAMGKLILPAGEDTDEIIEDMSSYPYGEEPKRTEASIRAMEGAISGLPRHGMGFDQNWSDIFWQESFAETGCLTLQSKKEIVSMTVEPESIYAFRNELIQHSLDTISTTGIDPKHEAVFGIGFYMLNLVADLIKDEIQHTSSGRIILRTLAESLIVLKWLKEKDDDELWADFRKHGSGQAKLQAVKIEESNNDLPYADLKVLNEIANEDQWDRFLEIELGHWSGINLRKMSEEAGQKDIYDNYYNWTSSYTHGGWGAIRESNYQNCANPLHRFHQIPLEEPKKLPSVLPDACKLCDIVLETISEMYPEFSLRIGTLE